MKFLILALTVLSLRTAVAAQDLTMLSQADQVEQADQFGQIGQCTSSNWHWEGDDVQNQVPVCDEGYTGHCSVKYYGTVECCCHPAF